MNAQAKIPASDEAWEEGQLGNDKDHAKVATENIEAKIDESLELQLISIRLQKSLIEDFKFIATLNGIGYQPLMRQVLHRFVDCEKKRILREKASEMHAQVKKARESIKGEGEPPTRQKRAA